MKLKEAGLCGTQAATVELSVDLEEIGMLCEAMEDYAEGYKYKKAQKLLQQLMIAHEIMQGNLCEQSEDIAKIGKRITDIDE